MSDLDGIIWANRRIQIIQIASQHGANVSSEVEHS